MKKHLITSLCFLLAVLAANAQDSSKVSIKPYGFIRNYLNIDSRETYTVVGGEYNMIPYDERWNEDLTEDLNAVSHTQLQALTSRFGVAFNGPQLWGWQPSGKLEGDFGGFGTQNAILRLRLAYLEFAKQQGSVRRQLLMGQDWHPLSGDIMPDVLGMAAGAPFRPHSRTPQLRGTIYNGPWGATLAMLYQLQYMNNGPLSASDATSTPSRSYADQALFPELFLGLNFRTPQLYMQLGFDYQLLHPRTTALIDGVTRRVDETVVSFTPTLYAQYVEAQWSIKARTLLAENTSHLNQLVGYGVTGIGDDGSWQYHPLRASISYLNIAWHAGGTSGDGLIVNFFFGYMKNLGCRTTLHNFGTDMMPQYHIYTKGGENFTHLNSTYRIAPSVAYRRGHLTFGFEYEWTAATYGDLCNDGTITNNANLHQVSNHRFCTMLKYSF